MAKRDVPDFDAGVAFDKALAQQKPDLAARLGAIDAAALQVAASSISEAVDETVKEPRLVVVPSQRSDISEKKAKRGEGSTKTAKRRRGVVSRASGKELRRLTVYVELDLAHELRKYCFENELNLSEVAAEALAVGLRSLLRGR